MAKSQRSPSILDGKVAVVTGASSGNGRAIARQLADDGASISILDVRDEPRDGGEATHELINDNGEAIFIEGDISKISGIREAANKTISEYGSIDIWINNAGITQRKHVDKTTEEDYYRMIDTNLKGCYFGCKIAIKKMKEQTKGGAIINIASVSGTHGLSGASLYCASKGGVVNLTRALACEVANAGIRVNSVSPGVIETSMTSGMNFSELKSYIPQNRIGTPKDIATVTAFLASEKAAYINGQDIVVDGGLTIKEM